MTDTHQDDHTHSTPYSSTHSLPQPKTLGLLGNLPCIDYVLVHEDESVNAHSTKHSKVLNQANALRKAFETAMRRNLLQFEREHIADKIFLKIYCPHDRLALEAERVKLEMPLRGCQINEEPGLFDRLFRYFITDDETDYVSGPFVKDKMHLFEGSENQQTFFRSSLRSLLVHHMLINLTMESTDTFIFKDSTKRQGLLHMLLKGIYKDAFVLHAVSKYDPYYIRVKNKFPQQYEEIASQLDQYSDPRKQLNDSWTKFFKFQPLWKIRNYLGEQIAFYFAWQGTLVTSLWLPAFLGLVSFFYGLYLSAATKRADVCDCAANGTMRWNETSNSTSEPNDCNQKSLMDIMAEDVLGIVRKAFNNEMNPWFSLFICIWGSIFLEIWKRRHSTLAYEWDVNNYQETEPDRPAFYGTQSIIDPITKEEMMIFSQGKRLVKFLLSTIVIFIMMMFVFLTLAGIITFKTWYRVEYGCPNDGQDPMQSQCAIKPDDPLKCILFGTLLPASMNAASVLIWEAVYYHVAVRLTDNENHQTSSDYNDALIIKLFAFQFVNSYSILFYIAFFRPVDNPFQNDGLFDMGSRYQDTCVRGSCMSLLALQVLVLMIAKPIAKFAYDIILPKTMKQMGRCHVWLRNKVSKDKIKRRNSSAASVRSSAASVDYLARECQKPQLGDFTIDEFNEKTIQFGYIIMFAAAFPLAPAIALIVNLIDMRIDARRLLWFNRRPVAEISSDIGMWGPILRFVNFCGIVTNAYLVATSNQLSATYDQAARYLTMLGFEHIMFVLVFMVDIVIPDVPSRIKHAMRKERYQVQKVLDDSIPIAEGPLTRENSVRASRPPSCRSIIEHGQRNQSDSVRGMRNRYTTHHTHALADTLLAQTESNLVNVPTLDGVEETDSRTNSVSEFVTASTSGAFDTRRLSNPNDTFPVRIARNGPDRRNSLPKNPNKHI